MAQCDGVHRRGEIMKKPAAHICYDSGDSCVASIVTTTVCCQKNKIRWRVTRILIAALPQGDKGYLGRCTDTCREDGFAQSLVDI